MTRHSRDVWYGGHNTQERAVMVGCVKPRASGQPVQRSATHVAQLACIAADAGHSAGGCLEGEEGGQCDCEGARACDLSVSLSVVVDCERGCASSATLPSSGDEASTAGSSGVVSTAAWSAGASASPSPWPASMAAHSVPAVEWYCGRIRLLMLSVFVNRLQAYTSAASADACEAACCAAGARCTTWQFCGDFTTYCGAEHGGCYIGAISAAGCHWQKGGCDAEACWVRGQGEMNVAGC